MRGVGGRGGVGVVKMEHENSKNLETLLPLPHPHEEFPEITGLQSYIQIGLWALKS